MFGLLLTTNEDFKPPETSLDVVERVLTFVLTFAVSLRKSLIIRREARAGIEPAHTGFADQCITTLLPRRSRCREPGMVGGNGGMSTVGRAGLDA